MAELNKFQRSKDKITEMINYLMNKTAEDEKAHLFIYELEKSIQLLDLKIEDFKNQEINNNQSFY
jgi:hypothetical protein